MMKSESALTSLTPRTKVSTLEDDYKVMCLMLVDPMALERHQPGLRPTQLSDGLGLFIVSVLHRSVQFCAYYKCGYSKTLLGQVSHIHRHKEISMQRTNVYIPRYLSTDASQILCKYQRRANSSSSWRRRVGNSRAWPDCDWQMKLYLRILGTDYRR